MPGLDELYKSLHVGAENELAGTTLMLWDNTVNKFIEVPYGVEAAATPAGPVANIPHISLQPDHPETLPNRAMIEHVGGPRQLTDTTYAAQLRVACETF